MQRLPHLLAPLLLVLSVPALPRPAEAACITPAASSIEIYEAATNRRLSEGSELNEYFSMARCKCKTQMRMRILGTGEGQNRCTNNERIRVMAGQNCYNETTEVFSTSCVTLFGGENGELLQNLNRDIDLTGIPANQLMGNASCTELDNTTVSIFIYIADSTGKFAKVTEKSFSVDTKSPAPPVPRQVNAGEELVSVEFGTHTGASGSTDAGSLIKDKFFKGYQVLCEEVDSNGTGKGVGIKSPKNPEFTATVNLCPGTVFRPADMGTTTGDAGTDAASTSSFWPNAVEAGTGPNDAGSDGPDGAAGTDGTVGNEAGTTTPDQSVALDAGVPDSGSSTDLSYLLAKKFVCSARITSPGKVVVSGLSNFKSYKFYVITIDTVGNPSTVAPVGTATPKPEEDLWERYKRAGGGASGGFCSINGEGGAAAGTLLLVLAGLLLLNTRRRSRGGKGGRR